MIARNNPRAALTAGMAAVLLSAFVLGAPVSPLAAFAQSDSMMEDGAMMGEKQRALRGQIANVQLDGDGNPAWVQSGIWVLRTLSGDGASFIARISMIATDGTSAHTHTISRFALGEHSVEGDSHTWSGTATVSAASGSEDGVPLAIEVRNGAVAAISIDPASLDGHFGENPIYGTVSQAGRSAGGAMMDKLPDASVPVTLPLTMGYVNGNEVFYVSTEASDEDLAAHLTEVTGARVAYAPALAGAPAESLANIYAFANGIEGEGPLGFQPNVADSQPGDENYSPLWRINMVEWQEDATPQELKSEQEVLDAAQEGLVAITATEAVVNCPFVQWEGGSLQIREDKELDDDSPYGGGQVLSIDTEEGKVTFVAHRGFAPDGSTIYYIATDASVKEVADALGVVHAEKTGAALLTGASSDLWVFTNGIAGTGPMGFQASIAGSNVGDSTYSPLWRILATTWSDAGGAKFLTSSQEIAESAQAGMLSTDLAGAVVNCPFVEV